MVAFEVKTHSRTTPVEEHLTLDCQWAFQKDEDQCSQFKEFPFT